MKKFFTLTALVFLSACGGGDDSSTTSSGATFAPTPGVFVARGGFFLGFPQLYQIVLEDGETWIVNEFNANSEPLFFATGRFQFKERILRTTTTTTVTITPDKTLTESAPEPINGSPISNGFVGNTNFEAKNALITINSNVLGTSAVVYTESFKPELPLAESVRVLSPEVGRSGFVAFRRGERGSEFDFDRPASVQAVVGPYGFDTGRFKVNMAVASDGAFNGLNEVTGCSFNGILRPHPSGKNVFAVNVSLSGCQDSGSYSGVAGAYPTADPTTGNGSMDFVSPSGQKVPSLFIATVNRNSGRVFSIAMSRFRQID